MKTHTHLLTLLLLPTFAVSARAYDAILTTEHVDLGLAYVGGAWDLHVHDETNLAEYAPGDALLYVDAITKTTRPAGSQWDFFGNNAGEDLWVLPFTQNPNALYLGIGAEETAPGTFATYTESDTRLGATPFDRTGEWVKLTLNAVNGPGHLTLYTFDGFNPVVWWSSAQGGISASDAAYAVAGGHNHYFWAFTAPGIYEVDVTASAFFGPGATNPTSDSATYHFGVETVPEPGSAMLLGLGLAAIGLRRPRRTVAA